MKKYYLSLLVCSLMLVNSIFATTINEEGTENSVQMAEEDTTTINAEDVDHSVQMAEEDICKNYVLDKDDELKQLIDKLSDEQIIKIIYYSRLLEKNHPLYLCEIDKKIDNWFKSKNKLLTIPNISRLLKTGIFLGGAWLSFHMGEQIWNSNPPEDREDLANKKNLWFLALCTIGTLSGVQGVTELKNIYTHYDQNQLYYKAIAIKDALLNYRKK